MECKGDCVFNIDGKCTKQSKKDITVTESMNTCDNCIHCEMCRWIDEVERDGCDFWDGNQKEEAREEIRQAAEGLMKFAQTGITFKDAEEADRYLKTLWKAFTGVEP